MKTGWLIVNGYLESEKFDEIYNWLIEAAKKRDCKLRKLPNDQVDSVLKISSGSTNWKQKPDFVLFWDKDVKLAKTLEAEGFKVFNSAEAIETCDDKALTFIKLKNTDIKMPATYMAPMTFDKEYKDYTFVLQIEGSLGYPMVIKENKGSFGEQVYLVNNYYEAVEKIKAIGHCDFIMQEYIESSKGRDVRIHIVGDKIVTAMERVNEDDFRANITNGGKMKKYTPTEEQCEMSERCVRGLGYQGQNLLCSNWNVENMSELDYNGMFEYLYGMKYGEKFNSEDYPNGIPKEEFESLIMEYLPITAEQIRDYAVFDEENQTYYWVRLGCFNYAPTFFGTSLPEVVDIKENEDGMVTLTVEAVCDMVICDDAVITHELTVRFAEDGSFQYLGNEILNDGIMQIPDYQYRIKE